MEKDEEIQKNSGFSIAGLILGILGLLGCSYLISISFIFGILSVIFGIIALTKNVKKGMAITSIVLGILIIMVTSNSQNNLSTTKDTSSSINTVTNKNIATDISNFDYRIENDTLILEHYKGNNNNVIIADSYNINNTNYKVTNLENSIFNCCDIKMIYIPKTITCIYDDTLAYLSAEHIELYFEGTENEWNAIFKEYKISKVSDKWNEGDAKGAGKALADKINSFIGHKYDKNKFTFHFEVNIEDLEVN